MINIHVSLFIADTEAAHNYFVFVEYYFHEKDNN